MAQPDLASNLTTNAQTLLELIKEIAPDGTHVGNISLRELLREKGVQWTEEQYWDAQTELSEKGVIGTGRGRGGALWLRTPLAQPTSAPEIPGLVEHESELYDPLVRWLREAWGVEAQTRDDFFEVKKTASPSGRKRDSGRWSRPDVSLVEVKKFDFLAVPQVEVTSFEVKTYDEATNLDSVYEAAAHSRWVNSSYLVVEEGENTRRDYSERFQDELTRFGVGLITMQRKQNGAYEFETRIDPDFQTPEPDQLDEFLQYFFTDEGGRPDRRLLTRFREKSRPS